MASNMNHLLLLVGNWATVGLREKRFELKVDIGWASSSPRFHDCGGWSREKENARAVIIWVSRIDGSLWFRVFLPININIHFAGIAHSFFGSLWTLLFHLSLMTSFTSPLNSSDWVQSRGQGRAPRLICIPAVSYHTISLHHLVSQYDFKGGGHPNRGTTSWDICCWIQSGHHRIANALLCSVRRENDHEYWSTYWKCKEIL